MMMYLEGEEPSIDEMKKVLRRATIASEAVPVFLGSAYKNKGVQKMLDGVIEYMPAPTDIPDITGVDPDGNEVVRHSSDDEPFSALAFKIMTRSIRWKACILQSLLRYTELRFICTECNKG